MRTMRMSRLLGLLGVGLLLSTTTARAETSSFEGTASIRVDAFDRVAVVLDDAPEDGVADRLWLFDPRHAFAFPAMVQHVQVTYDDATGGLLVSSPTLRLDLAVTDDGGTSRIEGGFRARGRALRYHASPQWQVAPDRLDTDAYVTIVGQGPITAWEPLDLTCAAGVVQRDTKCTKGGVGSVSVSMTCPGFTSQFPGESGQTTCGAGYYACGYCSFGQAFAVCRTTSCVCAPPRTACIIEE